MPGYPDIPHRERVAIAEYLIELASAPPRAKLRVSEAWVRTPNPAVDVAGAFLTIDNNTSKPVALVAVSSRQAKIRRCTNEDCRRNDDHAEVERMVVPTRHRAVAARRIAPDAVRARTAALSPSATMPSTTTRDHDRAGRDE
jgi:hypothetical protein